MLNMNDPCDLNNGQISTEPQSGHDQNFEQPVWPWLWVTWLTLSFDFLTGYDAGQIVTSWVIIVMKYQVFQATIVWCVWCKFCENPMIGTGLKSYDTQTDRQADKTAYKAACHTSNFTCTVNISSRRLWNRYLIPPSNFPGIRIFIHESIKIKVSLSNCISNPCKISNKYGFNRFLLISQAL